MVFIYFGMRQAEGVYNQRLQNLAVTLDKVTTFSNFVKELVSSNFVKERLRRIWHAVLL